jgi:hypothetical protein
MPGEHLGGGIDAGEVRNVVEVPVGERPHDLVQGGGRQADVDDDPVGVEVVPAKRGFDNVRRTVE